MLLTQQLTQLKLTGFQSALRQQHEQPAHYVELSFDERLSLLFGHELTVREQRKIERLLQQAHFRLPASLEQLDYSARRHLSKERVRALVSGEWLRLHQNVLITGATGSGKTYLSCALGRHFCLQGQSVRYFRLKSLLEELLMAQGDGSYRKVLSKIGGCDLLILDDWGLDPLSSQQRSDLLDLIDERYGKKSLIIVSQLPIENWYEMIGESTHADAILDRLLHGAQKIALQGESMRKTGLALTESEQLS